MSTYFEPCIVKKEVAYEIYNHQCFAIDDTLILNLTVYYIAYHKIYKSHNFILYI